MPPSMAGHRMRHSHCPVTQVRWQRDEFAGQRLEQRSMPASPRSRHPSIRRRVQGRPTGSAGGCTSRGARAVAKGWRRNRIAERLALTPLRGGADDPSPALAALSPAGETVETPWISREVAVARALRRAAWLLSQGQAAEAMALMRAAEALERSGLAG